MKAKKLLLTLLCLGVLSTVTGYYVDPGPPPRPYNERSEYWRQRREERARERAEERRYREGERDYRPDWQR